MQSRLRRPGVQSGSTPELEYLPKKERFRERRQEVQKFKKEVKVNGKKYPQVHPKVWQRGTTPGLGAVWISDPPWCQLDDRLQMVAGAHGLMQWLVK